MLQRFHVTARTHPDDARYIITHQLRSLNSQKQIPKRAATVPRYMIRAAPSGQRSRGDWEHEPSFANIRFRSSCFIR